MTKRLRHALLSLLMTASLCLIAPATRAGEAETKLMDCMRQNIPTSVRIQEFELRTVDRSKRERLLRGRLYAKREGALLRAMIKLGSPPDLKDAAYLLREGEKDDDIFVYLPALNKVRRVRGTASEGALFGTDFSYAEVKQLHNAFDGNQVALQGSERIEGRNAKILSMKPAAASAGSYSQIRAWVDEASCVAVKVEFIEGKTARKRMTAPVASLAKSGSSWYASAASMQDLRTGTETHLKITGVKSGEDLAKRYFDPRNFFVGG